MNSRLKNFFALSWPFIGLAVFIIWAWFYIKPLLPTDLFSLDKVSDLFKKEAEWVHPDEQYDFIYVQDDLKPRDKDELLAELSCRDEACLVSTDADKPIINVSTGDELAQAVLSAEANTIINLSSGIYRVNLNINKDLSIIGQGTSTVIVGGNKGTAVYMENCQADLFNFTVKDSHTGLKADNSQGEIRGLIIENNKKSGLELRNSEFSIKNSIITQNGSYGVFADAASKVEIEGNYIDENKGFEVRIEGRKLIYR